MCRPLSTSSFKQGEQMDFLRFIAEKVTMFFVSISFTIGEEGVPEGVPNIFSCFDYILDNRIDNFWFHFKFCSLWTFRFFFLNKYIDFKQSSWPASARFRLKNNYILVIQTTNTGWWVYFFSSDARTIQKKLKFWP